MAAGRFEGRMPGILPPSTSLADIQIGASDAPGLPVHILGLRVDFRFDPSET